MIELIPHNERDLLVGLSARGFFCQGDLVRKFEHKDLLGMGQLSVEDIELIPAGIQPRDKFRPVTVAPNSFFVMGHNRDHSYDSRFWDFVDLKAEKGRAFIIYRSWDSENFAVRWNRFGHLLK